MNPDDFIEGAHSMEKGFHIYQAKAKELSKWKTKVSTLKGRITCAENFQLNDQSEVKIVGLIWDTQANELYYF